MLKTALAMETGRLKPDAIIGLGALMESPASVFWWQMVLRERDSLRMMTTDKDGIVTPEQIRAGWSKTPIGVYPLTEAMVPHSALTAADIDGRPAIWLPFYQSERDIAVSHHDDELYSVGAKPVASYRWWKQFFVDWKPVAARLAGFSGRLDLIYGSIDSQTPAERQVPAAQSFLANAILTISILPNVGHTLGTNVLLGPMTNVALDQTVVTAAERAKGCKNSGEG